MDEDVPAESWLSRNWTKMRVFMAVTAIKILLIPSYRSTDFEVHRNWMAITHSLPMKEWYTESTSEWTLDYPPLFAWFEWLLSLAAKFVDPAMLQVDNLNYASDSTILFMRGTVILTDLVLALGALYSTRFLENDQCGRGILCRRLSKTHGDIVFFLIVANPGLLIVDHIHFQYNGFLLGLLLLSFGLIVEGHDLMAGVVFAVLVNLKHLFAVLGPVYAVYLLRHYCRGPRAMQKFGQLSSAVVIVCGLSFGPFIEKGQLRQVLSRLFPFGRGLCHAYWAPNAWALYAFLDKALVVILKWADPTMKTGEALSTGGLVGGTNFAVLPKMSPTVTVLLTLISILPVLYAVWATPNPIIFIKAATFSALTSFVLGYHVHEKASLMATVPAALTVAANPRSAGNYMFLVITATYAMFPLLFTPTEYLIKVFLLLTYSAIGFLLLRQHVSSPQSSSQQSTGSLSPSSLGKSQQDTTAGRSRTEQAERTVESERSIQQFLQISEILYLLGIVVVEVYTSFLHARIFKDAYPFLPLMFISVYCAGGIVWSWSQPDVIEVVLVKQD